MLEELSLLLIGILAVDHTSAGKRAEKFILDITDHISKLLGDSSTYDAKLNHNS